MPHFEEASGVSKWIFIGARDYQEAVESNEIEPEIGSGDLPQYFREDGTTRRELRIEL